MYLSQMDTRAIDRLQCVKSKLKNYCATFLSWCDSVLPFCVPILKTKRISLTTFIIDYKGFFFIKKKSGVNNITTDFSSILVVRSRTQVDRKE